LVLGESSYSYGRCYFIVLHDSLQLKEIEA